MKPDIRSIFSQHRLRVTTPRLAVFDALKSAAAPLSVTDIAALCPNTDKVSVYRSVDLFTRLGIAVSVPHGWKQRYELAAPFRPHHHHSHCVRCGAITDIHSDALEHLIAQTATSHNFTPTGHTFEITGICAACTTRQVS